MTTGEKITKLRKEQNITQEDLAAILSVSRQSVSKWESDACYPETDKIIAMAKLFHCSTDYLLRDDVESEAGEALHAVVVQDDKKKEIINMEGLPLSIASISFAILAFILFAVPIFAVPTGQSGVSVLVNSYDLAFFKIMDSGCIANIGVLFCFLFNLLIAAVGIVSLFFRNKPLHLILKITPTLFAAFFVFFTSISSLAYNYTVALWVWNVIFVAYAIVIWVVPAFRYERSRNAVKAA
jgi:transcriptional regulator with XRE-family HTH domain